MATEPTVEAIAEAEAKSPAYPWGDVTNGGVSGGLTKREYFAAVAMQGLAADPEMNDLDDIATDAVKLADVLLKELAK